MIALLLLFRYPVRSASALLGGALPLRYCTGKFAGKIPAWRLPVVGHVASLVTDGGDEGGDLQVHTGGLGVGWVSGPGGSGKRVRLTRKLQHTS